MFKYDSWCDQAEPDTLFRGDTTEGGPLPPVHVLFECLLCVVSCERLLSACCECVLQVNVVSAGCKRCCKFGCLACGRRAHHLAHLFWHASGPKTALMQQTNMQTHEHT